MDVGGVENIKAATLRWYHGSSAKAKHLRETHTHTVYDKMRVSDCKKGVFYPCALDPVSGVCCRFVDTSQHMSVYFVVFAEASVMQRVAQAGDLDSSVKLTSGQSNLDGKLFFWEKKKIFQNNLFLLGKGGRVSCFVFAENPEHFLFF